MQCPRCNNKATYNDKEWRYRNFDVKLFLCKICDRNFNAYYINSKFIFTIPKPGSKPKTKTKRKKMVKKFEYENEFNALKLKNIFEEEILIETKETYDNILLEIGNKGGLNRDLLYATLYLVLRVHNKPVLIKEISDMSEIPKKRLARTYRKLVLKLNIKIPRQDHLELIKSRSHEFNLSKTMISRADLILKKLKEEQNVASISPAGISAPVLYYILDKEGLNVSHIKIAKSFRISASVIRNNLKKFNLK